MHKENMLRGLSLKAYKEEKEMNLMQENENNEMNELIGIWTGGRKAATLFSNGCDILIDEIGKERIRIEGMLI